MTVLLGDLSTCSRGTRWKLPDLGSALDEGSTGQGAPRCSRPWEPELRVKAGVKGPNAGHWGQSPLSSVPEHTGSYHYLPLSKIMQKAARTVQGTK